MKKIILVIGAGLGGLAAACRLAARGYDVEIFEKRDRVGGKAYLYEIEGFKFDGGPVLLSAPNLIADVFRAAGKRCEDYLTLSRPDPFYRVFSREGLVFDYSADPQAMRRQIEELSPADLPGYQKLAKTPVRALQEGPGALSNRVFLKTRDALRAAPQLWRAKAHQSVYGLVSQHIKNEFLRQVFSVRTLLVGGNPFTASSVYALFDHLRPEQGVYTAQGGVGAIVAALERLFLELGGKINTGTEVTEILTGRRKVNGLRLADGSIHRGDAVLSNADIVLTHCNLLPRGAQRRAHRYKRRRYSPSMFVIHFGTRRLYTEAECGLARHNVILAQHNRRLFDQIFTKHSLPDDFLLFLHMPTRSDPSLAPEGCEAFSVFAPVPNLASGIDWGKMARPYRDRIMEFLEDRYLPDLRANIVAEYYIDPPHFQNTLNSHLGAAFSLQPIPGQLAWRRPPNRSREFDNLYFVGAGTHPGPGVHNVFASALLADRLIHADL